MVNHYRDTLTKDNTSQGLFPNAIKSEEELHDLVAFFGWTAWASAAERPNQDYTYTNNWPAEANVDNKPTADLMVWSALSLIALVGGTGLMFAIYGRWSRTIGWHGEEAPVLDFRQPDEVRLTPRRRRPGCSSLLFWCCSCYKLLWVLLPSTTVWSSQASSGLIWGSLSPTPSPEHGTCSSPSSGLLRRSWQAVSLSPRSLPAKSRRNRGC
ncbi:nitric-oxide reductase [Rothia aeria]|uniref:Nitric-oxide reductase n=1 Tax=Rothia aeria TaxID=172042 RepID=A0A2Z5QZX2_9MICC|nr:nitric-oxide reductase [Rothia aeria]